MSAMGKNLERWRRAVATHNVENPGHDPAYGIGMSNFDIERLGLTVGEELWDGVILLDDGKTTGNFRVLCNGEHDECDLRIKQEREAEEPVPAVSRELVEA